MVGVPNRRSPSGPFVPQATMLRGSAGQDVPSGVWTVVTFESSEANGIGVSGSPLDTFVLPTPSRFYYLGALVATSPVDEFIRLRVSQAGNPVKIEFATITANAALSPSQGLGITFIDAQFGDTIQIEANVSDSGGGLLPIFAVAFMYQL